MNAPAGGRISTDESIVRWRACPKEELVWSQWEEDFTVYHRATGETHLLNVLPAEVVRLLQAAPMTLAELAGEMAVLCDQENSLEWEQRIGKVLESLGTLSLVEKTTQ